MDCSLHYAFTIFLSKPVRADGDTWYFKKVTLNFFLSSLTLTDRILAYEFSFSPWRLPHEKPSLRNQTNSFPFWWNLSVQQVVVVIFVQKFLLHFPIKSLATNLMDFLLAIKSFLKVEFADAYSGIWVTTAILFLISINYI